jgi:hypothetical protein
MIPVYLYFFIDTGYHTHSCAHLRVSCFVALTCVLTCIPLCSKYKINTVSTFPPNNRVTYSPNTLSYAFMICSLVNKIIMACGAQRP